MHLFVAGEGMWGIDIFEKQKTLLCIILLHFYQVVAVFCLREQRVRLNTYIFSPET